MLVDASLLRRAKVENVERLARSLGVAFPKRPKDGVYHSQLVSSVASKIRREAILDELKKMGRLGS
jgi:hypothetical protein